MRETLDMIITSLNLFYMITNSKGRALIKNYTLLVTLDKITIGN